MKKLLFTLIGVLLFSVPLLAESGPEATNSATPVFEDWSNKVRSTHYPMSSASAIVVSSKPSDAGLGTSAWRYREIVNQSTVTAIQLYFDKTYTTYIGTGTVLNYDSSGYGDKYVDRSQVAIYAVPQSTSAPHGRGLGVTEYYYKP